MPLCLNANKLKLFNYSNKDLRDRIELIQDFDMPIVSTNVQMTPDGQYIFATGKYFKINFSLLAFGKKILKKANLNNYLNLIYFN